MMAIARTIAICLTACAALAPQTQRLFAQKYVTVVGNDGKPVAGLASEDFNLRDGDTRRPMQGAEPTATPLAVELAISGFGETDNEFLTRTMASTRLTLMKNPSRDELVGAMR